jgi:hypothetical protein
MSNIDFTCPHCSFSKQLPASADGMQGNCPSCNAEVLINPDNTESEWLVMSTGLKSEAPTKLNESEIIALIRDETIAGGAQLSNLSESTGQWMDLKGSHFYQYVEEVKAKKQQIREQAKADKIEQKHAAKRTKTKIRDDRKQQQKLALDARHKKEQQQRQSELVEQERQREAKSQLDEQATTSVGQQNRQSGSGAVIIGIILTVLFGFGGVAGYLLWVNSKFEAAEKIYANATEQYLSEMERANDVLNGATRLAQFLEPQDALNTLNQAGRQSTEILSNATAKYEKAYSIFSNICADLGKPPPESLLTL